MASTTTNLGLTKPAYTDDADVAVINANSDIIDAAYGSLSDQIGPLSYLKTDDKTSAVAAINSFWDEIFNVPTTTLTDVDLNDTRTPGAYLIGSGCTNTPSLNDGKLLVLNTGNANYTRQFYIGGYNVAIFTRNRYYSNGWIWSSWLPLVN